MRWFGLKVSRGRRIALAAAAAGMVVGTGMVLAWGGVAGATTVIPREASQAGVSPSPGVSPTPTISPTPPPASETPSASLSQGGGWFAGADASPDFAHSADLAYEFLDGRADEYCTTDDECLPRSHRGGYFTTATWDYTSSFVYDDALMILAFLARGGEEDTRRARAIGDALIFVQEHDPRFSDGRTRASYQPASFKRGVVEIGAGAAYTGNQAWAGMALARLYSTTEEQKYLDAAVRLGDWIQTNASDTRRVPHGYTGGRTANNAAITYKATEHNIDVLAFFTQLAELTDESKWSDRAAVASSFVEAMQSPTGHLWTGTTGNGTTTNRRPIPEDPQAWSYLATLDSRYSSALTWTVGHLRCSAGRRNGFAFARICAVS